MPLPIGRTLYSRAVLFDSSALVALAIGEDAHHADAVVCLSTVLAERLPAAVAVPTIYEAHRRILQLAGTMVARSFLRRFGDGSLELIDGGGNTYDGALRILDAYPHIALTLTDAVSVAIMLDRGIGSIFSFDDDFLRVGVLRVPPL